MIDDMVIRDTNATSKVVEIGMEVLVGVCMRFSAPDRFLLQTRTKSFSAFPAHMRGL